MRLSSHSVFSMGADLLGNSCNHGEASIYCCPSGPHRRATVAGHGWLAGPKPSLQEHVPLTGMAAPAESTASYPVDVFRKLQCALARDLRLTENDELPLCFAS